MVLKWELVLLRQLAEKRLTYYHCYNLWFYAVFWFLLVRLSDRPSANPSVGRIVSAVYLPQHQPKNPFIFTHFINQPFNRIVLSYFCFNVKHYTVAAKVYSWLSTLCAGPFPMFGNFSEMDGSIGVKQTSARNCSDLGSTLWYWHLSWPLTLTLDLKGQIFNYL